MNDMDLDTFGLLIWDGSEQNSDVAGNCHRCGTKIYCSLVVVLQGMNMIVHKKKLPLYVCKECAAEAVRDCEKVDVGGNVTSDVKQFIQSVEAKRKRRDAESN